MWAWDRITLQLVRICQPTFSAAFIALVETTFHDDVEKNSLCVPIPLPHLDIDWLRMLAVDMANHRMSSQHDRLTTWLAQSRLNNLFNRLLHVQPTDTERMAFVQRLQHAVRPAMENLQRLLTTTA